MENHGEGSRFMKQYRQMKTSETTRLHLSPIGLKNRDFQWNLSHNHQIISDIRFWIPRTPSSFWPCHTCSSCPFPAWNASTTSPRPWTFWRSAWRTPSSGASQGWPRRQQTMGKPWGVDMDPWFIITWLDSMKLVVEVFSALSCWNMEWIWMDEVVWSMMFYLNMSQGQNDHFTWQKKTSRPTHDLQLWGFYIAKLDCWGIAPW